MTQPSSFDMKSFVMTKARALGLDAIGIARLEDSAATERLRHFLSAGRHGDMDWMATNCERRSDPRALWPQARTAIMVGHSYAPDHDPMTALDDLSNGVISIYAQGRDYHNVLKGKIKALAREFAQFSGSAVKVFVDTAPLMEKPLAATAGLGWQGKHTNLVSREHGSWLFLGAILTTAELAPDEPEPDHCGSCSRCMDVCPTKAFPEPYQLDARRCLAYLSIEHRGHIALEFRKAMANRVFGCDDCLAVCPWNKFAQASQEAKYAARHETANPPLAELLAMDDASFRARFAGTPVKRTGRDRVVRNALIAAGNSADTTLLPAIRLLVHDASSLVRAMAVWALYQLADPTEQIHLRATCEPLESDPIVAAEWQRGQDSTSP
jgi:epoxyqueuosine reductase